MFLEKSGAQKGFVKEMFTHLYNSIFSESHNVLEEFEQYYQIEYETVERFLRCKYALPQRVVKKILEDLMSNTNNTLIDFDSLSYGMNDNASFLFGEKLYRQVEQILTNA